MTARAELFRSLGALVEAPSPELAQIAGALRLPAPPDAAEHSELFLFQLYPYASIYTGAEGMLGGEAADRVAGFWRALGSPPPPEPDHLAALLAFYAALIEAEDEGVGAARSAAREARRAFLWEHLLSWAPLFLDKLSEIAMGFYRSWASLLSRALLDELSQVGGHDRLPLHLRSAPPITTSEASARELLTAILAPARSGIVLTRVDLARGAETSGVGLRMGERRFILEAMLGQDARATLQWLADEAATWEQRHLRRIDELGIIARHWGEKAATAGDFFVSSLASAEEVIAGGARR